MNYLQLKKTVNITAYLSEKVLFQGAKRQQEASIWADKSSQVTSSKKNIKDLNTPSPKDFDH